MLNLAKVLCLLLVAEAKSPGHVASDMIGKAQKSLNDVITLSLNSITAHHAQNVECVRAEMLRIDLEKDHVHPELQSQAKRGKFDRRVNRVMATIGNYTELMKEKIDIMDKIYERESVLIKKKELLADACIPRHTDKMFGKLRAVACVDKVRDSVRDRTQSTKSYFSRMCTDSKKMAKSVLAKLKVVISSQ